MTKQQTVAADNRAWFSKEVNILLDQGWRVIPGTVAISMIAQDSDSFRERYVVFLEKYVPDVTEKMI